MRDFSARHLERAVADEHDRTASARDLHAKRRRYGKPHRRVVGRTDDFVGADVDGREQRVAGVDDDGRIGAARKELVQCEHDVPHSHRLVVSRCVHHFRRQLIGRHVGRHRLVRE